VQNLRSRSKAKAIDRIEGEALLNIYYNERGDPFKATIEVSEAPRFFEKLIIGRKVQEVPDLVSRICGICYSAHQIASIRALEKALGLEVTEQTETLRKLLAYGGMIQSHALHFFFLAVPDFFGNENIFDLTKEDTRWIQWGYKIKSVGDLLTELIGGRAIHPITPTIGGFKRRPKENKLKKILKELYEAREVIKKCVDVLGDFELPKFLKKFRFVTLTSDSEYPVNRGLVTSGLDIKFPEDEYLNHIKEKEVPHSTSKRAYLNDGSTFIVGPLARLNMNFDKLNPVAKEFSETLKFMSRCDNLFSSHLARVIEMSHFLEESIKTIEELKIRDENLPNYEIKPNIGCALVEAPRGLLFHQYEIDKNGRIKKADIITPTVCNLSSAEEVVLEYVQSIEKSSDDTVRNICERLIRCYDFCLSCSVHVENIYKT